MSSLRSRQAARTTGGAQMSQRRLHIAYCGNFGPSHSTETHLAASLEAVGHTVDRQQEDEAELSAHAARAISDGADLWLFTRTWHDNWIDGLTAVSALRDAGIVTASVHLDLYLGLAREYQVSRDNPFWATDVVFSADGDPNHAAAFAARGIDHVWLRPGVYKPECYVAERSNKWPRLRAAFVGSWRTYHREHAYRRRLIERLRRTFRGQFDALPRQPPAIRGHALNELYASVPVIVGDSCNPGFALSNYWSDRVYETLGRGGFLVHPAVPGLDADFAAGELVT